MRRPGQTGPALDPSASEIGQGHTGNGRREDPIGGGGIVAEIIRVDGTRAPCGVTLSELQKAVGGYIEGVHLADGRMMYCNEDGKAQGLLPNEEATTLGRAAGIHPFDVVVGDVVVLTLEETKAGEA